MSDNITIPPEAIEAAARAYAVANDTPELWWRLYEEKSRAACLAMLKAWPGAEWLYVSEPVLALPMPSESTNAEG